MKKWLLLGVLAIFGFSTAMAVPVADPFGNPIFVRGGFNGWGITDEMTWDGVDEYNAVLTINAGNYGFKIADEGWSNPDFGPTGDQNVVLGAPSDIGTAIGTNFILTLGDTGQYLFTLYDLAPDLQSGQLLVTRFTQAPQPALLTLMLIGLVGLALRRRRPR